MFSNRLRKFALAICLLAVLPAMLSADSPDDADESQPAIAVRKPAWPAVEVAQAVTPKPSGPAFTPMSSLRDRLDLRLTAHRMAASASASDQANIATVLANPQMVDAAATVLREEFDSGPQTSAKGAGPILTFFEFLLANSQAVEALIASIIAMFGGA